MARIQQVAMSVAAIGSVTPWMHHDFYQSPFNLTLSVFLDSAVAGTFAVQFVAEDLSIVAERQVTVVQTASTTATITDYGSYAINGGPNFGSWGGPFGHGLLNNDVAFLVGTQSGIDAPLNQGYPITVVDANHYTVVTPVNQTINVQARVTSGRVLTHQTLQGLVSRASGPQPNPIWMSRLLCTAFTSAGKAFLVAMQGDNK